MLICSNQGWLAILAVFLTNIMKPIKNAAIERRLICFYINFYCFISNHKSEYFGKA